MAHLAMRKFAEPFMVVRTIEALQVDYQLISIGLYTCIPRDTCTDELHISIRQCDAYNHTPTGMPRGCPTQAARWRLARGGRGE